MDEITDNQQEYSKVPKQLQPFQYKKGQTGNPNGRPAGKSLKEYTRERIASMTDEQREEFLHGIPKETVWKMTEGNPDTKIEANVEAEITNPKARELAEKYEEELKKGL